MTTDDLSSGGVQAGPQWRGRAVSSRLAAQGASHTAVLRPSRAFARLSFITSSPTQRTPILPAVLALLPRLAWMYLHTK
eukprot:SAG22_NODE_291_length_12933_cov_5.599657_2_plen_79_part_00